MNRERYPLTSQLIEENKIPEFGAQQYDIIPHPILTRPFPDNLYVDFNGIIHNCTCISFPMQVAWLLTDGFRFPP